MVGYSSTRDTFACLAEANADDFRTANVAINDEGFIGTFVMVLVVDGELIVERPTQTISRGKLKADVLFSVTNIFEGRDSVSAIFVENQTIADYISQLMPQFTDQHIQKTAKVHSGSGFTLDQANAIPQNKDHEEVVKIMNDMSTQISDQSVHKAIDNDDKLWFPMSRRTALTTSNEPLNMLSLSRAANISSAN